MSAYAVDNTPENRKVAEPLKKKILEHLKVKGSVTMADLYKDLKCDDIPMYLAIDDLVKEKKIQGESPYKVRKPSHKDYTYSVAKAASVVERLDGIAEEVEQFSPVLALAIDRISDQLEGRSSKS